MKRSLTIPTPLGPMTLTATERAVTSIRFGGAEAACGALPRTEPVEKPGAPGGETSDGPGRDSIDGAGRDSIDGAGGEPEPSALLRQAAREIGEYFAGRRRSFTLPLAPEGTPFQQEVWEALRAIPYGRTRSYKEIAAAVGRPRACRAVGMANHRNPIALVIPCHRVVGASGALTGYAGGLALKARLLALEAGGAGEV